MCFETFAWLLSTDERNANCSLFSSKGNYSDHFKHNMMKTREKSDSTKNPSFKTFIMWAVVCRFKSIYKEIGNLFECFPKPLEIFAHLLKA